MPILAEVPDVIVPLSVRKSRSRCLPAGDGFLAKRGRTQCTKSTNVLIGTCMSDHRQWNVIVDERLGQFCSWLDKVIRHDLAAQPFQYGYVGSQYCRW